MPSHILNGDLETRSRVDLKKVGTHIYARHPSTRILTFSYSFDAGKTMSRWRPWLGGKMPGDLSDALRDRDVEFQGWNAASFERLILRDVAGIDIDPERFHDTMIRAKSMALPGSLELCALALEMPVQKADSAMMKKWMAPLPDGSWADDPDEFADLCSYCDDDVRTEAGLAQMLRPLSPDERLDVAVNERINDRGFMVDISLARAAQRYAKDELADICDLLNTITRGVVTSPKQYARIKKWLAEALPEELQFFLDPDEKTGKVSFDAAVRDEILGADYDDVLVGEVREFIELVHDGGKASTAKFAAMQVRTGEGQRLRGAYNLNGAGQTGRFSATGFQPHNLIRASLPNIEDVVEGILRGIPRDDLIRLASYDAIDGGLAFTDGKRRERIKKEYNVLTILSRTLRPSIIAPEGKILVWRDWSSIEARMCPWLSLENSASAKLDLFASGADVYVYQAAQSFGVDEADVTPDMRQGGKIQELSFQFGGGAGAGQNMARKYGLDIDEKTANGWKEAWRQTNPWARRFWSSLESAAYMAVRNPDEAYKAGRVTYMCTADLLWCMLPSGRMIAYPFPRVTTEKGRWGESDIVTAMKSSLHPKKGTSYWPRMKLWGGFQCVGAATEVLTPDGWMPITEIGTRPVWDGVSYVRHDGVVFNGNRLTGSLDGVRMTPDHRVLTKRGWREASQCEGLQRMPCRLPDNGQGCRHRWQASDLAGSMRMWPKRTWSRQGAYPGQREVVRLQKRPIVDQIQGLAWHDESSGVCSVAFDESALPASLASGLEELRRAGHTSVRKMAERIQIFLDRHAPWLSTWLGAGSSGQRRSLHPSQLSLGFLADERTQQTEAVYDIVNCGPRHRFVVRGSDGPLIVHNCENVTQAEAASLLRWARRELYANGWPQIGDTHDDILLEVDEDEEAEAQMVLKDVMERPPQAIFQGLPLASEGSSGFAYGK